VLEIEPIVPRDYLYAAVRSGVAVIARDTWSAMRGRDALRIEWDHGDHEGESNKAIDARMREALDRPLKLLRNEGDAESAWAQAGADGASERRIESFYEVPIIGHGCMEPMNFTADVRADGCTLWGPSQHPRLLQYLVGRVLELETGAVRVQTTLEGGGFGRRLSLDYGVEAALVSKRAGVPVKVVWTREDDLQHDYYRGPSLQRMRAVIGDDGLPRAWHHTLVNSPLLDHIVARENEHPEIYDVDGGANVPYPIEHLRFDYGAIPIGLQLGSWRSVSHTFTVFAVESFLDEIAAASRLDPLELRLRLLGEPRQLSTELPYEERHGHPYWNTGRLARVLETAARAAGWGEAPPQGRSRGIACCYFKDTYAAHVAEVSVDAGVPRVHRIVAAIDCGRAVNPDGVAAQVEGAAIDGMATVFKWEITVDRGRVQQRNFDGFPRLRIGEAPAIEVHIVPSEEPPSGTGEPPYPSVAPAVVNALFAATGKRVRKLPIPEGTFG